MKCKKCGKFHDDMIVDGMGNTFCKACYNADDEDLMLVVG
jgi:hypothetical protein